MTETTYNQLTNEVVVRGRYVNLIPLKNGNFLMQVVSRNGQRDVFPTFLCKEEPKIKRREHVLVKGYVVDRKSKNDNGKIVNTQQFVAEDIIPDKTITEETFGIKGAFFNPPSTSIKISGELAAVKVEEEWVRFTILTNGKKKTKNPASIRMSMKKRDRPQEYNVGDMLYAVGGISTTRKEVDGKTVYYEDIIVNDAAVCPQ